MKNLFCLLLIILLIAQNFACAMVKPYQREILAKKEMQFDADPEAAAARAHFLNSLEGSTGGFGTGGGGCGCN